MTIPQAIAELEDRGVPEVIRLIKDMNVAYALAIIKIEKLEAELDRLKYGEF